MIDELVSQIEARFGELQQELSDPAVIGDRGRFTATSKAYSELEPAARLATDMSCNVSSARSRHSSGAANRSSRCGCIAMRSGRTKTVRWTIAP